MNRQSTLIILLLVGPCLASAQACYTPPDCGPFSATSGSLVIHVGDVTVPFTAAGPDFSASGDISYVGAADNPLFSPRPPGAGLLLIAGDSGSGFFDMSLTVRGVPWDYPVGTTADGDAMAQFFIPDLVLPHPGIFSFPFDFNSSFRGRPTSAAPPGVGCDVIICTTLELSGGGTATLDVVPDPNFHGLLDITQASYTLKAPEPSTTALLLLGFAALGFQTLARMRREHGAI